MIFLFTNIFLNTISPASVNWHFKTFSHDVALAAIELLLCQLPCRSP